MPAPTAGHRERAPAWQAPAQAPHAHGRSRGLRNACPQAGAAPGLCVSSHLLAVTMLPWASKAACAPPEPATLRGTSTHAYRAATHGCCAQIGGVAECSSDATSGRCAATSYRRLALHTGKRLTTGPGCKRSGLRTSAARRAR